MTPITTAELREAFDRVPHLRFRGISFDKALAVPLIRFALEAQARHARRKSTSPVPLQPALF